MQETSTSTGFILIIWRRSEHVIEDNQIRPMLRQRQKSYALPHLSWCWSCLIAPVDYTRFLLVTKGKPLVSPILTTADEIALAKFLKFIKFFYRAMGAHYCL